jgi:hypothetical protein
MWLDKARRASYTRWYLSWGLKDGYILSQSSLLVTVVSTEHHHRNFE